MGQVNICGPRYITNYHVVEFLMKFEISKKSKFDWLEFPESDLSKIFLEFFLFQILHKQNLKSWH